MNLKQWIDSLNIDTIDSVMGLVATKHQLEQTLKTINDTIEHKPSAKTYAMERKKLVVNLIKQCEQRLAEMQQSLF